MKTKECKCKEANKKLYIKLIGFQYELTKIFGKFTTKEVTSGISGELGLLDIVLTELGIPKEGVQHCGKPFDRGVIYDIFIEVVDGTRIGYEKFLDSIIRTLKLLKYEVENDNKDK